MFYDDLNPRILVIDQDIKTRRQIARILASDYTIDTTSSGSLAYLLMKEFRYALVISSLELPNRHHGLGIVRAIHAWQSAAPVPILGIGPEGWSKQHPEWYEEGLSEYQSKPLNPDMLKHRILSLMKGDVAAAA